MNEKSKLDSLGLLSLEGRGLGAYSEFIEGGG
jgi:hypothetical protein